MNFSTLVPLNDYKFQMYNTSFTSHLPLRFFLFSLFLLFPTAATWLTWTTNSFSLPWTKFLQHLHLFNISNHHRHHLLFYMTRINRSLCDVGIGRVVNTRSLDVIRVPHFQMSETKHKLTGEVKFSSTGKPWNIFSV